MEDFLVQFLRKEKELKETKQKPKIEYKNYEVNPSR
jgi:flagellar biosynthesis protein FlhB